MHQMASTRPGTSSPHYSSETDGAAGGPGGQSHPAYPSASRGGGASARTRHLEATDPRLQSRRGTVPVAVDDQQGAALLSRPGRHRTRPRRGDRPSAKAEHHQIQPVHQHRGHFHRIGAGIGDHREPAQIGTHLDGSKQTHLGLTHDRHVPTRRRHRSHQSEWQRPGSRQHRHRTPRQRVRQQFGQRFRYRQQIFSSRNRGARRHGSAVRRTRRGRRPSGHLGHLSPKVFYLLSTAFPGLSHIHHDCHENTLRTIRPDPSFENMFD